MKMISTAIKQSLENGFWAAHRTSTHNYHLALMSLTLCEVMYPWHMFSIMKVNDSYKVVVDSPLIEEDYVYDYFTGEEYILYEGTVKTRYDQSCGSYVVIGDKKFMSYNVRIGDHLAIGWVDDVNYCVIVNKDHYKHEGIMPSTEEVLRGWTV